MLGSQCQCTVDMWRAQEAFNISNASSQCQCSHNKYKERESEKPNHIHNKDQQKKEREADREEEGDGHIIFFLHGATPTSSSSSSSFSPFLCVCVCVCFFFFFFFFKVQIQWEVRNREKRSNYGSQNCEVRPWFARVPVFFSQNGSFSFKNRKYKRFEVFLVGPYGLVQVSKSWLLTRAMHGNLSICEVD